MNTSAQTYQITNINNDDLLIDVLYKNTPLSKQKLKTALTNGAVWLESKLGTHRARKAKKVLKENDIVFLYYNNAILQTVPNKPTLVEDFKDFSIWHKPYGMYCQGSKWGDHCTINRWVEKALDRPAFIVHRLDRATTGLIIIAHTKTMAQYFSNLFQLRQVEKHYRATVYGNFQSKQLIIDSPIENANALSIVDCLNYDVSLDQSLLNVEIKTGRKHQIRIHLSSINFPIVGDRMYGDKNQDADLQLCCYSLAFINPISNKLISFSNEKCA